MKIKHIIQKDYSSLETALSLREGQLRKIAYSTFKDLSIPEIPINIDYIDCPKKLRATFNMQDLEINTYIFDEALTIEQDFINKKLPHDTNWEKSLFILFHEIGHYLHYFKYREHFNKLWKTYKPLSSNKMEIIANRIAHILLKKFKEKLLTNTN